MKQFYTFGQAYGEGAYGECTYSPTNQQCDTSTGGSTGGSTGSSSGSGSLVDTGLAIALTVTLACLLIFVAVVVRFIRRPRTAVQEVSTEAPRHDSDNFRP